MIMAAANASPEPQRAAPIVQDAPEKSPEIQCAEPAPATPAKDRAGQDKPCAAGTPAKPLGHEEPDLALEPDLPSDGRDEVGEAMIRNLPQRPELSEPPSQPDPSNT